ncbi:MAG: hypothetical protein ACFFCM_07005, partial [Promethearchaeota archaeon]
MTHSIEKELTNQISALFLKADEEVHKYNWSGALDYLKEAEKISVDEGILESETYYKLGELYQISADYESILENVLKNFTLSISYYQKAHINYEKSNNHPKINTCLGFINLLKYISGPEWGAEETLLESAKNYFNIANQHYIKNRNLICSLKIRILECRSLELLIGEKLIRLEEHTDSLQLILECDELIKKIWEELKNQEAFPEIYLIIFLNSLLEYYIWIVAYFSAEKIDISQFILDHLNRLKEIIGYLKNSKKILSLFIANSISAIFNLIFAIYHVNNQFEQKKYLKLAEKWLKKAELLLPKINSNLAKSLFYYSRFNIAIRLISLGYFAKDINTILEDLKLCINSLNLTFPRLIVAHFTLYTAGIYIIGSFNPYLPNDQRINMVKRAQKLIRSTTNEISVVGNPNYKIFNLELEYFECTINAMLGDLSSNSEEKSNYLSLASKIFHNVSDYSHENLNHTQIYSQFLNSISRVGITLAKNSLNKSEKVNYYQKAINVQLKSQKMLINVDYIGNLFIIGNTNYKLETLINDETLKNSYSAYINAIEYCINKGYFNLVGSAYVNLAKIEDRRGNFLSAADNYEKAINSFDKAIMTLTYSKLGKKIQNLKNYINAWKIIELAKSYHTNEDHYEAELNYQMASVILKDVSKYRFEAPFYSAWAYLEKAEDLSKKNKHQEAAATYLVAKNYFEEANEILNSSSSKKKSQEENERISNLVKAAEIRKTYCTARHQIETARLQSKKGNHLPAAELYNKASFLFENICEKFRIKKERDELTAIFFLCKAWENMERAEVEGSPNLYKMASDLFEKAAENFPESRMKKLSIANSNFCLALENRELFDKSTEIDEKIKFYKRIKMFLRESSKNYQLGGFTQDAQWSLATSTFFDGIWHLILSDNEIDFTKKKQYLNIATQYLDNASQIFIEAGYLQKKEDISSYLEMINSEKAILTSALDIIEKPEI